MSLKIKLLVIDVDGTMTDAGIYYDENGNELKKFSTRDAAGYKMAKANGIGLMVLTGRECYATLRRMKEMEFDYIFQNIKDKQGFMNEFICKSGLSFDEVGYIGDDLNDYSAMILCGYRACPADSCTEIKDIADYISSVNGGSGAVRDCIEHLLRHENCWCSKVEKIYCGV